MVSYNSYIMSEQLATDKQPAQTTIRAAQTCKHFAQPFKRMTQDCHQFFYKLIKMEWEAFVTVILGHSGFVHSKMFSILIEIGAYGNEWQTDLEEWNGRNIWVWTESGMVLIKK